MSTMAAQQLECEKERREAARLKLALEEAQREVSRREAIARIPMQVGSILRPCEHKPGSREGGSSLVLLVTSSGLPPAGQEA